MKPANNRKSTKQRTDVEPDIRVVPHKNEQGQFFQVELYSQARKGLGSKQQVQWQGSELGLRERLEAAAIELADRQNCLYGDEWDIRELRTLAWERYRQLVSRFAKVFAELN